MQYCCYYSYKDIQGKKLKIRHLDWEEQIFHLIDADSVEDAIIKFKELYPTHKMIGIRKNKDFQDLNMGTGLINKLYKK